VVAIFYDEWCVRLLHLFVWSLVLFFETAAAVIHVDGAVLWVDNHHELDVLHPFWRDWILCDVFVCEKDLWIHQDRLDSIPS